MRTTTRRLVPMMSRVQLDEVRRALMDIETILDDIAYAVQARAGGANRPAAEDVFAMCLRGAERVRAGMAALPVAGRGRAATGHPADGA